MRLAQKPISVEEIKRILATTSVSKEFDFTDSETEAIATVSFKHGFWSANAIANHIPHIIPELLDPDFSYLEMLKADPATRAKWGLDLSHLDLPTLLTPDSQGRTPLRWASLYSNRAQLKPEVLHSATPHQITKAPKAGELPAIFDICHLGYLRHLPAECATGHVLLRSRTPQGMCPLDAHINGGHSLDEVPRTVAEDYLQERLADCQSKLSPFVNQRLMSLPAEQQLRLGLVLTGRGPGDPDTRKAALKPLADMLAGERGWNPVHTLTQLVSSTQDWQQGKMQAFDERFLDTFPAGIKDLQVTSACRRYQISEPGVMAPELEKRLAKRIQTLRKIYQAIPEMTEDHLEGLALLRDSEIANVLGNVEPGQVDRADLLNQALRIRQERTERIPLTQPYKSKAFPPDLDKVHFRIQDLSDAELERLTKPGHLYLVHTSQSPVHDLLPLARIQNGGYEGCGFYTDAYRTLKEAVRTQPWFGVESENSYTHIYELPYHPKHIAGPRTDVQQARVEDGSGGRLSPRSGGPEPEHVQAASWVMEPGVFQWPCSVQETLLRSGYFPPSEPMDHGRLADQWGRHLPAIILKAAGLHGYFTDHNNSKNEFVLTDYSRVKLIGSNVTRQEFSETRQSAPAHILCFPFVHDPQTGKVDPLLVIDGNGLDAEPAFPSFKREALESPNVRKLKTISEELGFPVYAVLFDKSGATNPEVDPIRDELRTMCDLSHYDPECPPNAGSILHIEANTKYDYTGREKGKILMAVEQAFADRIPHQRQHQQNTEQPAIDIE